MKVATSSAMFSSNCRVIRLMFDQMNINLITRPKVFNRILKTDQLEIGAKNIAVQLHANIAQEIATFINTGKVEQFDLNDSIDAFTFAKCTVVDLFSVDKNTEAQNGTPLKINLVYQQFKATRSITNDGTVSC